MAGMWRGRGKRGTGLCQIPKQETCQSLNCVRATGRSPTPNTFIDGFLHKLG